MADIFSPERKLSPRMRRGVAAMLIERDIKSVAEAVKVTERTIYRWLTLPEFITALRKAESDVMAECGRRLISGQAKALGVLESLMDNAEKESDQRLAACAWLDFTQKFMEINRIQERLDALEEIVFKNSNGKNR